MKSSTMTMCAEFTSARDLRRKGSSYECLSTFRYAPGAIPGDDPATATGDQTVAIVEYRAG